MLSRTSSSNSSKRRQHKSFVTGHTCARGALVFSAFSFIAALLIVQLEVSAAHLYALKQAGEQAWGQGAPTSPALVVGSIILVVLGLLGMVFVILLTYGGFLWLSAAGEEDKVKKAQGLIIHSIIGVFIVIAAYTIAFFVLEKIGAAVGTG